MDVEMDVHMDIHMDMRMPIWVSIWVAKGHPYVDHDIADVQLNQVASVLYYFSSVSVLAFHLCCGPPTLEALSIKIFSGFKSRCAGPGIQDFQEPKIHDFQVLGQHIYPFPKMI